MTYLGNLGISLGKTNYLLKELAKKGLLKPKNFTCRGGKIRKVKYILTKKGFEEKLRLTWYFLKRTGVSGVKEKRKGISSHTYEV